MCVCVEGGRDNENFGHPIKGELIILKGTSLNDIICEQPQRKNIYSLK